MTTQRKKAKLKKRNYLVPLVMKKSGAGPHKNRKRENKNKHEAF
jgi:hypothetical protein